MAGAVSSTSPMWSGRSSSTRRGCGAGAARPGAGGAARPGASALPARRSNLSRSLVRFAERKRQVGLAHQRVAHQGASVRLADRIAERRHVDLKAQRVARPNLLAETAGIDAGEERKLAP